ncbi:hypothetical protein MIND_00569000 [Mycena indigotica]|uniref:Uncharacterized protein n=1 Tax=Mycena indigotica TaxID=2126181 RepID=A0A8H6W5B3_9AGAR|nr:uncharacterized protein MIND_00569000 [Mycena indigotica]KAF7303406.1 hypothetical protein MIND_00569000 [Mycena indigotica]
MSLILHLLKHLGARNVPTLKSLRKIPKKVHEEFSDKPVKITGSLGNIFYMNDIRHAIARDFSNPLVVPHLHLYPEEVDRMRISERWQAGRLFEYTAEELTPIFKTGTSLFRRRGLCAKAGSPLMPSPLSERAEGLWDCTGVEVQINADNLDADFDDLMGMFDSNIVWTQRSHEHLTQMPSDFRKLSGNRDLYVVSVSIWIDDVSGNKSKQYNKFMMMLGQNTSIPGRILKQEFHVNFMAASQNASTAEFSAALRDSIRATETDPMICYNAGTHREAAIILRVVDEDGDNPQQSEEASHMGCNSNHPCRKCKWGGTRKEKESGPIYHECHTPGMPRTAAEIQSELLEQLHMATSGSTLAMIAKRQTETGTKDKLTQYWIEQVLKQGAMKKAANPGRSKSVIALEVQQWLDSQPGDKVNPLLDIKGLDPARDTPVEILHTILLGAVRYVWHHLHTKQWSDEDRHLLAIRLESTDISAMNMPPMRAAYKIQYRNNLIGKDYKAIMQALVFHVHGICTPEQFRLVKATADLGAWVWVPEIDNMSNYIAQLKTAVANVLDAWDAVDPLSIIVKIKLHLLAHLPEDVERYGPPIRFSTETHKGYNAIFRMCSVNGNNQRHLGWAPNPAPTPGFVRFLGVKTAPALTWSETMAKRYWTVETEPTHASWRRGQYVIAQSGDRVKEHTWVFTRDMDRNPVLGRVKEIVGAANSAIVTLEQFVCTETRHPDFQWPVVRRPNGSEITAGKTSFFVVDGLDLLFSCSVQHDCKKAGCRPSVVGKQRQER